MQFYVDNHAALPLELQEEYLNYNSVKVIDQIINVEQGQLADFQYKSKRRTIEAHCLYQIQFEVKRGQEHGEQACILSALIIRSLTGDSIVEPSKVSDEDRQPDDRTQPLGGVWVWGVKILYMLKMNYLLNLKIKNAIFYIAYPLYRDFIEDQFAKRLEAKNQGNEILSLYYKNIMNTLYGKTGQKANGVTETGDACHVAEEILYLASSNDRREAQTMEFKTYLQKDYLFKQTEDVIDIFNNVKRQGYNTDLHQLLIKPSKEDELNQIGSLVRIAAFISSIGQLELVQAFNQINLQLNIRKPQSGQIKFCYTDTDSIYFDFWEPLINEVRGTQNYQTLINLEQAWMTTSQQFEENGQLSILHENICQLVKQVFVQSQLYRDLMAIQIFNPTRFALFENNFPMIDQNSLGAFKIERLCFGGVFTAPKQYTLLQIDMEQQNAKVTTLFKGKGVNKETLKKQPTSLFKQETGFVTVVEKLNPLLESAEMVTKLTQYRANYSSGLQNLDQILSFLKSDYTQICRNAIEQSDIGEIIKSAAQSLVCIFVNESAFQASGSFITIRDVAKTVLPSISKRFAITVDSQTDGVTSLPPSDLFAFEVQRVKQSASLSLIRSYVINNIESAKTIISLHRPLINQDITDTTPQQMKDAHTASNSLRAAIKLSQLANKITNRLFLINDIVRNVNPTTISEINDKLISPYEQKMDLQQVMELFNYLNAFSEHRSKFKQLNSAGEDDLFVILKYVYFESQKYWFWPLTFTNFSKQLIDVMRYDQVIVDSLLDDYILCACISNFTRIFKITCDPIKDFLNTFNQIYIANIGRVKPIFDVSVMAQLISQITMIQSFSYARRDPLNAQITRLTVREHMTLSTNQFIVRNQAQPSTIAKALISKFREITQHVEERRIQQVSIQMLNQVRIGVVAILRDSIQENFSFSSIKPLAQDLQPLLELDQSLLIEQITPIYPDLIFSNTCELSKVKRIPQTLVGDDVNAALDHLHSLRSRLTAKFEEAQDDALMTQLERSQLLRDIQDGLYSQNSNNEVQIIT